MLFEFSFSNFLTFRDEVALNLIASNDDKHEERLIADRSHRPRRVLRAAGIYGANGHGKTNFFNAMRFARQLIVRGPSGETIPLRPYRSSEPDMNSASTFVFQFSRMDLDFEYGFKINSSQILEEWLYYRPRGRDVLVFERKTSRNADGVMSNVVSLGTPLRRKKRGDKASGQDFLNFVAAGMPINQLFLKEAVARNVQWLRIPFDWFANCLTLIGADSDYAALSIKAHEDQEFVEALTENIRQTGVGIDHVETSVRNFEIGDLRGMPEEMSAFIEEKVGNGDLVEIGGTDGKRTLVKKNDDGELKIIELLAVYRRSDGSVVKFNQDEESAGTRRLFNLLPMLHDLVNSEKTFVIDELDRKLHPLLSYGLVSSFLSSSGASQLIFTTHNTHLLDLSLFRRDEIWFVEKNKEGVSDLYSLMNLKVRPDVEIRRGYLNGRFGAIPFVGNVLDLGWIENDVNIKEEKAAGA